MWLVLFAVAAAANLISLFWLCRDESPRALALRSLLLKIALLPFSLPLLQYSYALIYLLLPPRLLPVIALHLRVAWPVLPEPPHLVKLRHHRRASRPQPGPQQPEGDEAPHPHAALPRGGLGLVLQALHAPACPGCRTPARRTNPLTRGLGLANVRPSPGLVPRFRDEAGALTNDNISQKNPSPGPNWVYNDNTERNDNADDDPHRRGEDPHDRTDQG